MTSTVNPLHIVPPSHHSTPQHSRYPSSMTGTATSSSISTPMHTSSKQLNDWYLKVAVGGRRNFLFQEDNLTPAPYHHEPVPQPPQFDDISNAGDNQVIQIEGQVIEPLNLPSSMVSSEPTREESTDSDDNNNNNNNSNNNTQSNNTGGSSLQNTTQGTSINTDVSGPNTPRGDSKTPPLTPIMRSSQQPRKQFNTNNEAVSADSNDSGGSAIQAQSTGSNKQSEDSNNPNIGQLTIDSNHTPQHSRRGSTVGLRNFNYNNAMTPRTKRRLSDVVCNSGLSMYLHAGFGQDSYFVACDANSSGKTAMVLGIADGVGGWRSSGVDSGIMSRAIMRTALNLVQHNIASGGIDINSEKYIQSQQSTPQHKGHSKTASLNNSMDIDDDDNNNATHQRRISEQNDLFSYDNNYSYTSVLADPRELMSKAYYQVKAENIVPAGSTTACIVSLLPVYANQQQSLQQQTTSTTTKELFPTTETSSQRSNQQPTQQSKPGLSRQGSSGNQDYVMMRTANLGDSGYIVVRFVKNVNTVHSDNNLYGYKPTVVGFTSFQRDESNVVKQLAVIPESIATSSEYYEYCDDKPEEASTSEHKLLDGDIVILASDGLWDNFDIDDEPYINNNYGYSNSNLSSSLNTPTQQHMMRMRLQQHINDQDRIRRQHNIIERIVMESLTNTPSSFVSSRDSPRQDALNNRRRSSADFIQKDVPPEIDPAALCARLMQHSLEFQRKPDGKPDDLSIIVAQLKRKATTVSVN